jgi:hypothetical protein
MAGNPRNLESVIRGDSIVLDIYIKNSVGVLVDSDTAPTYTLTDPDGTTLETGSGTKISTGYYQATYEVSATADISNYYKIVWVAYVSSALVPDSWEYWQVITAPTDEIGEIIISNTNLNLIKSKLAYPLADDLLLDDDGIKTYCVYPALLEYFRKFPIKVEYTENIASTTTSTIDFPDDLTFGATDARVNDKFSTTTTSSSSFWELVNYQRYNTGFNKRKYGIEGYNPSGLKQANFTSYQAHQAETKYHQIIRVRVDTDTREVTVYSNISGLIYIEWAKYSLNFSKVKFQQTMNVIKLCQSYLLNHMADTANIVSDSGLDININADELKTKAEELRDEVTTEWEQYTDIVLIRT